MRRLSQKRRERDSEKGMKGNGIARERQKEGGGEVERQTLNSLRASVCRASEGRVLRGERRPSLQKLKASLFHKEDSGKRRRSTHTLRSTHTQAQTNTKIEFQSRNDSGQLKISNSHTLCCRRKHSLQRGLRPPHGADQNNTEHATDGI